MSMKDAKASNWVAEIATPTASGFSLKGSSKGYASFSRAFSANQQVFYSAHDENGSREAGYATFDGRNLVDRKPTATLVAGVYSSSSPSKMNFSGDVTVACTFNAAAFNTLWSAFDQIDPDGDGSINIPPELINGLGDALAKKADQVDLDAEIAARIAGDADLQAQIDAIDPDGDLKVEWDEIGSKPTEFPPEAHNHEIDDVNGLQDALDAAGGTPAWDDVTGKPTEFPPATHNQDWSTITNTPSEYPPEAHDHDGVYAPVVHGHEIDEINGLQDALDSAGGNPAWGDITGKPTEFPPEAHTHEQSEVDGLEDRLDAIEDSITSGGGFVDAPNDGKLYGRQSENWAEVVIPDVADPDWADIQNKPTEFTPEAHVHTIANVTGLQDALDDKADADHTHEIADVNGLQDALDNAGGGGGSPVHIGDTALSDPAEGDLWYDASSDTMFLFDGTAWFSTEPCGSGGGSGGIEEAPEDGIQYARKDAAWEPVEAFDDTQISADLAKEVADREAGDLALQSQIEAGDLALQGQIDALGSSGGGSYEVIESVDLSGADQYDFDLFPDTHTDFKALFYIGFPVNTFGSPTLEIKVNGETDVYQSGGKAYSTVSFLPNTATGQTFENTFLSITPNGTSQGLPHVFGEINFHTANMTFTDTNRHNVSAYSVSNNGNIINIGGAVATYQGDKFTGFRFKTPTQILSGYFRLVGIRKN